MTKIITITNQKGGVLKTSTVVSLAHRLSQSNHNTLIIDADPQGNVATCLGFDPAPGLYHLVKSHNPSIYLIENARPGLSLLPGNQQTKQAINQLTNRIDAAETTRQAQAVAFSRIAEAYDYAVIDTPASGILQEIALSIATTIIIPTALDYLALDAVRNTLATIHSIEPETSQQIIILPTLYQHTNEAEYNLNLLTETYPGQIAPPVPYCAAVREAIAAGHTVWEHTGARWARRSRTLHQVRGAYDELVRWIIPPH